MSTDKKIAELEKLSSQIANEKSFDKSIEIFNKSAELVKEILNSTETHRGRVMEVIADVDGLISKLQEFKTED